MPATNGRSEAFSRIRRSKVKKLSLLIVLFTLSLSISAQQAATVVQIQSRPAASLIEAVRPVLGKTGGVSAFHDKLILRGTAAQIEAAKAVIADLDRPARRLIIEVNLTSHIDHNSRRFGYGVRTDNVQLGRVPPPGSRAQLGYQQIQTQGQGDALQRVQALDGQPALIMAGQSVPVYQTHQQVIGNTLVQGFNMSYRDANQGFVALPRVHGDQVTVEIYQQNDRPAYNGRFNTQAASTVLRGNLGEWLTLGSVGGSTGGTDNRIGGQITTRRMEDRQLQLRVLPVD